MEATEKELKNKKRTIIILSVILSIMTISFVAIQIFNSLNKHSFTVYFVNQSYREYSILPFNELQITCDKDTLIKVSDFSYKQIVNNEERYIPANGLICNDKEYGQNESFIIYANKVNELTIHGSINADTNSVIYYQGSPINLYQKKSF